MLCLRRTLTTANRSTQLSIWIYPHIYPHVFTHHPPQSDHSGALTPPLAQNITTVAQLWAEQVPSWLFLKVLNHKILQLPSEVPSHSLTWHFKESKHSIFLQFCLSFSSDILSRAVCKIPFFFFTETTATYYRIQYSFSYMLLKLWSANMLLYG